MIQYHSHPATQQDQWVVKKGGRRLNGYFIEIGAHDGIRHSNTATLEQCYGWTGLLVEPNPDLFNELVNNRPLAQRRQAAIGPRSERFHHFVMGDSYGGLLQYLPEDWRTEHQRRGNRVVEVETISLIDLLVDHECPAVIDYLSLDVEGAELPILEAFFNAGHGADYRFRYLTVEFRYDRFLLSRLEELLWGYQLDEIRGFDACFVNKRYA